jgi:hypothetical protein
VVVGPRVDGTQDCQFIDVLRKVGKNLGDFDSALTVFLELERARHQWTGPALADIDVALARQRLSRISGQRGFGIECIDMTGTAAHE